MTDQKINNQRYILIAGVAVVVCGLLYMLRSVLLPFVVGIALAYFLNPFVRKMPKISRPWATMIVLGSFLLILFPLLLLIGGAAVSQIGQFFTDLPQFISAFGEKLTDWLHKLSVLAPSLGIENVEQVLQGNIGESFKPVAKVVRSIVQNGFALVNVISLLLIAPVVAFYMLRDWPEFVGKIYDLIPKKNKKAVKEFAEEVNRIISGYLRGQFWVCVILGTFYSCGLWLVGLDLGVLVGFLAGLISFIPYVGSISGFLTAMVLVVTQYGTLPKILEVVAVFLIGQFLEGNFLTPKLVGENIGLHPVWVMFALLAGGVLLGLLGMIIAVPVAACIGVLLKMMIKHYKKSAIYLQK